MAAGDDQEAAEHFNAPAPSDLVRRMGMDPDSALGMATGFGLGMAGDPMTWGGGAITKALSGPMGLNRFGKYAARVAEDVQPFKADISRLPSEVPWRYAERDLNAMTQADRASHLADFQKLTDRIEALRTHPMAAAMSQEIRPGIVWTGHGAEGFFGHWPDHPEWGGIRISGGEGALDTAKEAFTRQGRYGIIGPYGDAPMPRITDPEMMLQAARSKAFGPYRLEHLPLMDVVPESTIETLRGTPSQEAMLSEILHGGVNPGIRKAAQNKGLYIQDIFEPEPPRPPEEWYTNPANVGRFPGTKNYVPLDPGTIADLTGRLYPPPEAAPFQGDPFTRWLVNRQGAREAVQGKIASGLERASTGGLPLEQLQDLAAQTPFYDRPGNAIASAAPQRAAQAAQPIDRLAEVRAQLQAANPTGRILQPGDQGYILQSMLSRMEGGMSQQEAAQAAIESYMRFTRGEPPMAAGGRPVPQPRPPDLGPAPVTRINAPIMPPDMRGTRLIPSPPTAPITGIPGIPPGTPTGINPAVEAASQASYEQELIHRLLMNPSDPGVQAMAREAGILNPLAGQGPLSRIVPGDTPEDILRRLTQQQAPQVPPTMSGPESRLTPGAGGLANLPFEDLERMRQAANLPGPGPLSRIVPGETPGDILKRVLGEQAPPVMPPASPVPPEIREMLGLPPGAPIPPNILQDMGFPTGRSLPLANPEYLLDKRMRQRIAQMQPGTGLPPPLQS
jgi:hypothetical protein